MYALYSFLLTAAAILGAHFLFLLAHLVADAFLGLWMNRRHRKGVLIPIGLVFMHLLFVVTGYVFLLASRFTQ